MSPFDRLRFSNRTLTIAVAALYAVVFGIFPILYAFGGPEPDKLITFLLKVA